MIKRLLFLSVRFLPGRFAQLPERKYNHDQVKYIGASAKGIWCKSRAAPPL
jgi:hypothetical protein